MTEMTKIQAALYAMPAEEIADTLRWLGKINAVGAFAGGGFVGIPSESNALLDEVASWLPFDGDHRNIRARFDKFRSDLCTTPPPEQGDATDLIKRLREAAAAYDSSTADILYEAADALTVRVSWPELYRPSNGTEGDSFRAAFCDRCTRDRAENPCPILGATMAYDVDDPEYPREWFRTNDGPTCTAFSPATQPEARGGVDDCLQGHAGTIVGWWRDGDFLRADADDNASEFMDKGWVPIAPVPPSTAYALPGAAALSANEVSRG